jgi:hypothetical protein
MKTSQFIKLFSFLVLFISFQAKALNSVESNPGIKDLFHAIENNDLKKTILILESVNINEKNENGKTALHKAVEMQNLEIVSKLISKGADILNIDSDNSSALDLAEQLSFSKSFNVEVSEIVKVLKDKLKSQKHNCYRKFNFEINDNSAVNVISLIKNEYLQVFSAPECQYIFNKYQNFIKDKLLQLQEMDLARYDDFDRSFNRQHNHNSFVENSTQSSIIE